VSGKVTIDMSMRKSGVTVKSDELTVDLDPNVIIRGPAAAIAGALSETVRAKGWVDTGTLANGISAVPSGKGAHNVVAPPRRLERPDLLARFLKEMPDPSGAPSVKVALVESGAKIVKVRKRR
jgi:hypothetical protein